MSNENQSKDIKLTPGGRKFHRGALLKPSPACHRKIYICTLMHTPVISSNDSHIRRHNRLINLVSRELLVTENWPLAFCMHGTEEKLCKLKQPIKTKKRKKLDHHCGKVHALFFSKKDRIFQCKEFCCKCFACFGYWGSNLRS